MTKAYLKVGQTGKFAITEDQNPTCNLCKSSLKIKSWVFWCNISKELFCEDCMRKTISHTPVSFNHYLCSGIRENHEDWFVVLDIKKKA